MPVSNKRFITAALPYANGPLHFGHLAGVYIPADIYYRHSRLNGFESLYVCGSDEHGVAITLSAEKHSKSFQEWVDQWFVEHQRLFKSYDIQFDAFGRTTSKIHEKNAQDFFKKIHDNGFLKEKSETQAYCKNDKMFLPDRYLTGTCGRCGYAEARGDECPNCGAWLQFEEIKNPKCAKCGKSEIEPRQVSQWYFDLPKLAPQIRKWLESQKDWKENVRNYALSLLESSPERAITRNVKWGIDLPAPWTDPDKKIYVWFEAPVGYLSNLQEYFEKSAHPEGWKDFWNAETPMIHFIGKDNIIFHTIIWPSMLLAAGQRLPTNVPANMFVQLMKKQFSKSAGWYVDAEYALNTFGVDRMRYYLTTLIPESQDTNFDWMVFREKVNAELVNKIANLFNRVGTQVLKHYGGRIEPSLFASHMPELKSWHERVVSHLEKFEINLALTAIVELTEEANKFLDESKPWNLVKESKEKALEPFARATGYMFSIASLLQPFVPTFAARVLSNFSIPLEDKDLLSHLYRQGGAKWLQGRGLQIKSDANFVIMRLEQAPIDEEIKKLGALKA